MPVFSHDRQRLHPASGQGILEFALVLPVVLGLVFAGIDLGRYSYIKGTLDANAQRAARLLALPSGAASDCLGQNAMVSAGNAIAVTTDPASVAGDAPGGGGTPLAGQGYAYIWPAVATPSAVTCAPSGANRGISLTVRTRITYIFVPWTPIISRIVGPKTITVYAAEPTEY